MATQCGPNYFDFKIQNNTWMQAITAYNDQWLKPRTSYLSSNILSYPSLLESLCNENYGPSVIFQPIQIVVIAVQINVL